MFRFFAKPKHHFMVMGKFKTKRWLFTLATVAILVGVSFSFASEALALEPEGAASAALLLGGGAAGAGVAVGQALGGGSSFLDIFPTVEGFLASVVGTIIGWVVAFLGFFIRQFTKLLIIIAQYNGFVNAEAVKVGWTIVRDVANLFFVLVLLAIAIGTILRIEAYNLKKALVKVIIMAVLVNFSKTIAGLIIDAAQVIMLTFVAGFALNGEANLMKVLHVNDLVSAVKGQGLTAEAGVEKVGILNLVVSGLVAVILLLIVLIVIAVMAFVLLMRMVMLWLLIVLSPLAFVLEAFPQGQRYARQWWTEFSKYVIIGPVLAFFLWLSLAVVNQGGAVGTFDITGDEVLGGEDSTVFLAISDTNTLLSYIIAISMLIGGLILTQKAGVIGSSFAGDMVGRIRKAGIAPLKGVAKLGWRGTKLPFGWVGRKYSEGVLEGKRWAPPLLNVKAAYRGFQARRETLHERARLGATAGAEETWEKLFTGAALPRRIKEQFAEQAKFATEYKSQPKEQFGVIARELMRQRATSENLAKRRGLVQAAEELGYDDDILLDPKLREKYGDNKYTDIATGRRGTLMLTEKNYTDFYRDFIGQPIRLGEKPGSGKRHEAGLQVLIEGDNVFHRVGHSATAGMAMFDPDLGYSRMATIKEGGDKRATEFGKLKARQKLGTHFHGENPIVIWKVKEGEPAEQSTAGPFSDINETLLASKYTGQQDRGLKEHTTKRTVQLQMGAGMDRVILNKKGQLEITGDQLQNLLKLDRINDHILADFSHISGITDFRVNNQVFSLSELAKTGIEKEDQDQAIVRARADLTKNILAAKTAEDWRKLVGEPTSPERRKAQQEAVPRPQRADEGPDDEGRSGGEGRPTGGGTGPSEGGMTSEDVANIYRRSEIQQNLSTSIENVNQMVVHTEIETENLSGEELKNYLNNLATEISQLEGLIKSEMGDPIAGRFKKDFEDIEAKIEEAGEKDIMNYYERQELARQLVRSFERYKPL